MKKLVLFLLIINLCSNLLISHASNNDDNYKDNFQLLFHAVRALEFDYLGGSGSRGYGKLKFKNFKIKPVLKNCKIETKEEGNEVKNEETKIIEKFEKIFETFNVKKSSKAAEQKS